MKKIRCWEVRREVRKLGGGREREKTVEGREIKKTGESAREK